MNLDIVTSRLNGLRKSSKGFLARCPAHEDRDPSLSVTDGGDRILLHCFAGCELSDILTSIGLDIRDIFEDDSRPNADIKPALAIADRRRLASRYALEFSIVELEKAGKSFSTHKDQRRLAQAWERLTQLCWTYGLEEFEQIAQEHEHAYWLRYPQHQNVAFIGEQA